MDRRHFVKTSILAALANPIHAMSKTNSIQRKNRKKGQKGGQRGHTHFWVDRFWGPRVPGEDHYQRNQLKQEIKPGI